MRSMSHEKEAAEEKAKVLLVEREYHLRYIKAIEERLAKLSRERGLSIPLP